MGKSNVKVMYCPEHGLQFWDTQTETFKEDYPCEHAPRKENMMEYPEEIYATRDGGLLIPMLRSSTSSVGWGRQHAYQVGYKVGYEAGKAERPDPLAGYSNLTAAIQAGEPIDWERLNGKRAKCVNHSEGSLRGVLTRNGSLKSGLPDAWWGGTATSAYINALYDGWHGKDGWTLWVEGEIPLRRKTADQLPLGTCFEGGYHGSRIELAQVIANRYGNRLVTDHAAKNIGGYAEEEVEVIKEYGIGTFQKPEGK